MFTARKEEAGFCQTADNLITMFFKGRDKDENESVCFFGGFFRRFYSAVSCRKCSELTYCLLAHCKHLRREL